jgi:protein-S-isoprenylcysteine O-methyltransferase Ste14
VAAGWNRIARRIRVPLGFVFAVLFLWLARPSWLFLAVSLVLVVPGLLLRGYASGYVKKNRELTVTGPYAHTRNPLYLGSMMIAFGFALAARSIWIAVVMVVLFLVIYVPVIGSEEEYLRSVFPEFDAYAATVPRLLPRFTAAGRSGAGDEVVSGVFSAALYRKHREYNALMGAVGMYAALILKWMLLKK